MARLSRIENSDNREISTRNELDKLRDIIRNKHDNVIDFSSLEEHKSHEKIKNLDLASEALFDFFVIENWNTGKNLKNIIGDKSLTTPKQKTEKIHEYFQQFLKDIFDNKIDISKSSPDIQNSVSTFQTHFEIINKEKEEAGKTNIELTKLELNLLQDEIIALASTSDGSGLGRGSRISHPGLTRENVYHGDGVYQESQNYQSGDNYDINANNQNANFERQKYKTDEDHIDKYDIVGKDGNYSYHNPDNHKEFLTEENIEDIYSDKNISKVLAKIFKEDNEEIKRRHFEINLSAENGLASIILDIQEKAKQKNIIIEEDTNIFLILKDLGEITDDPTQSEMTKKDTKKVLDNLDIPYRKDGAFKDFIKLTKLFNNAQRKDLVTFANLLQSRTNISRVTKERYNNKILLKSGNITKENVLLFLSDINSDGIISADNKNKDQFKVGDVGNISGQQLYFTIEQARKTQNAILGGTKGDEVVVKNITKMISLMVKESEKNPDYLSNYANILSGFEDVYSKKHINEINNILAKTNPTNQDLINLLIKFPESKVFFLAAVEKVTGGSSINQADLYDVLTGQEGKRLQQIDTIKEMEDLRRSLDTYIKGNSDFVDIINEYGSVELRETILQKIMDTVDNIGLQISFDAATEKDMIMSNVNKTFYKEQAKKKILDDFNIQNIEIGTNLSDIKLSYKIGKGNVSSDGRSKYHIAGGPAFYLGKNGISGGIDINFTRAEQINYAKVSSASLDAVQNAKYLGIEGGAGAKVGTNGIGLYAALGASYEKDPLMGIMQLEKTYKNTSNRVFDISGLKIFTKQSIKSHLETNLNSLQKGIYKDFIGNNLNRFKENIRFVVDYLEKSGIISEINSIYKNTKEKEDAIGSLLRIIQQGNIDQWKGDVIMNLNGKLDLTRFSAGITAGSRFFGTKSDNYTGDSNGGEGDNLDGQVDPEIPFETGGDAVGSSSGGSNKIGFLGVYVSARISTWKNKYLPNSKQVLMTEQEMNQGVIDHIDAGKDLDKYALYLEGLFNKTETINGTKRGIIIEKISDQNKIKISYVPFSSDEKQVPLYKLLNIHYSPEGSNEQFIYTNNTLIIGNVGPIAAYTTTMPGGIDRVLCLGAKNLDDAKRLDGNNIPPIDIQDIEFKENGFEYFNKTKIDQIIDTINLTGNNIANEKTLYKSLFDNEGKLLSNTDVTLNDGLVLGQKFNTGTLTLYKKSDGKYILDYQSSPDDKLIMEYKTIGTNQNTILNVSNPDLSETFTNINLPNAKDVPDIEHEKTIDFNNFIKNISSGNFDKAETSLLNIIGSNSTIGNKLKNGSAEEKQNIIDNYVSIFAYEKNYEGMTINEVFNGKIENGKTIRKGRGNLFLNYEGPGKTSFSGELKKDLLANRKSFIEKQKNNKYETFERETPKNIFGYTAFYRSGVTDRGYGATPFGKTNIIKGSLYEIGKDKDEKEQIKLQQDGKQRIIANLKQDPRHRKLLVKQIQKAINNDDISKHINEDNLAELIIKKEIKIPSTETNNPLDISSKIIKLNSDVIFYLLGECLNESVGLRIKDVEVVEELDTYKAEQTPDKKYTSNLFGRSNSISGEIQSEMKNLGLSVHKKIKEIPDSKNDKDPSESQSGEGEDLDGNEDGEIDHED
ncbi:MAG: hypothetical protein PHR61_00760 [Candidatus Absconditabacteria bacterium]|nr:hypothetical protein [Candidatus Absconditabacteria bacterium]